MMRLNIALPNLELRRYICIQAVFGSDGCGQKIKHWAQWLISVRLFRTKILSLVANSDRYEFQIASWASMHHVLYLYKHIFSINRKNQIW